jgi:hypothetical protein
MGDPGTAVSVRPLGRDDYETISGLIPANLRPPSSAAYGLPAFWADATLLAVPQLGVTTDAGGRRSGLMLVSEPVAL